MPSNPFAGLIVDDSDVEEQPVVVPVPEEETTKSQPMWVSFTFRKGKLYITFSLKEPVESDCKMLVPVSHWKKKYLMVSTNTSPKPGEDGLDLIAVLQCGGVSKTFSQCTDAKVFVVAIKYYASIVFETGKSITHPLSTFDVKPDVYLMPNGELRFSKYLLPESTPLEIPSGVENIQVSTDKSGTVGRIFGFNPEDGKIKTFFQKEGVECNTWQGDKVTIQWTTYKGSERLWQSK